MAKPWRLTRRADAALLDIARWTVDTFGPRQAAAYEDDLIARFEAIAAGSVPSRSSRALAGPSVDATLLFARSGQHFIVFLENADEVIIVDLVHARSDLPAKLARLGDQTGD
jgi:toxin ParE1/3/4